MNTRRGDRGQILVIFTGGLIVLFAIAAVVIDLGFAFITRRAEQNIADPGAIAAARWIPAANAGTASVADMRRTACSIARANGLFQAAATDDGCIAANDADASTLSVNFPPSPNAVGFAGRPGFVEVVLTQNRPTLLGRILGMPTIRISSSAVAAFSTGDSNSNSLVALDPTTCSSGVVSGTNTRVTIQPAIDPTTGLPFVGGYVHVNSACGNPGFINDPGSCGPGEGQSGLTMNSNGSDLIAPKVYVAGTCSRSNNNNFNSPLVEGAVQIGDPLSEIPPPRISDYSAGRCGPTDPPLTPTGPNSKGCNFPNGTTLLQPGIFYGGWTISNNSSLELQPGIYIIAGGGITLSGTNGSLEAVSGDPTVDARVMIFSTDNRPTPGGSCGGLNQFQQQGPLSFSANSSFHAKALATGPYKGILLWQDGNGCQPTAPVSLGGNGDVVIAGTIYAPKASVTLNGGATGTGSASIQIISWQWSLTGGATLTMPYDPRELYTFEEKGLVR
jgi:Flp pilus assembly protein TadG